MEFYTRDIQIIRQSQQKIALDFVISKGITLSMMELQRVTDVFVECCIRPMDDDLKLRIKKLDEWLDEKSKTISNLNDLTL